MRSVYLSLATLVFAALAFQPIVDAQAKPLKGIKACNEALKLLEEGKAAEALKVLDDAKGTLDPEDEWLWWGNRGACYRDLRKDKEALESFAQACKLKPDCWFRFQWCRLLHEFGRWDEAEKEIEQEIDPDYADLTHALKAVMAGPFKERWPNAYKKLEVRSKYGNYHVISDTGVTVAQMDALEAAAAKLNPKDKSDASKLEKLLKPHDNLVGLAALVELARKEYLRFVNPKESDLPKGKVFKVIFFTKEEDFHAYATKCLKKGDSENTLGFFQPNLKYTQLYSEGGAATKIYGLSEETIDTFFHEGWHQFFDMLTEQTPIWLDEGLAEFLGPAAIKDQGRSIELGVLIKSKGNKYTRYERLKEELDKGKTVPFKEFFRYDSRKWNETNINLNYAQAWGIAYYALKGDNDLFRKDYCKFFWECAKGKRPEESLPAIFTDQKLADYEKAWKAYWKKI